ncbi:porphobilinogen synthase [Synoicihabitans lomoniglobus]|uniref:Delta-aminolevulinic acid dehydratase n=1 Tax=Synoicihabitans lomoniglobus TaxID=2909285 RepID=A0AAF0CQB1_9BACT|nr:porphobilinogen synthase [Opitutaceae bacterium LMO-M01]WED66079.1 porphobilinogen synthase [Opitutaceae bacterium LMO-M01]
MSSDSPLDLVERPRRLRRTASLRAMVQETVLRPADFIAPLFVVEGKGEPEAIASMSGVFRYNVKDLVKECRALAKLGVPAVALFPKLDPKLKDEDGTGALNEDGLILRAVRAVKKALPELTVITDVALDPYTTHGHDGVLTGAGDDVDNDRSVGILSEMAVLHAQAGVDIVAPSDMMDGRIGAIRELLDAHDFTGTAIMAYSAKFNSAYYGPFRDAVGSSKAAGTRLLSKATYQLDPANRRQALNEAALDEDEGADFIMVKPAGAYLDIIREVREETTKPVAAYQVSGEYAQIQAAAQLGWLDLARCRHESLLAIKRAGADLILTYFAKDMAKLLK